MVNGSLTVHQLCIARVCDGGYMVVCIPGGKPDIHGYSIVDACVNMSGVTTMVLFVV